MYRHLCERAGGWFPYFHDYYARAIGAGTIFVITPAPDEFAAYDLLGVLSVEGFPYDDNSRSPLVSGVAQGLLALFEWTIVCDVDEIIIPHPFGGNTFLDELSRTKVPVSISRGLDIIQGPGDAEFDMSVGVLEQRRHAAFNSALCKPHFARVPTRWGPGYHFADYNPQFEPEGQGFITLHLKWASSATRQKVAEIVQGIEYADSMIGEYSVKSVTRPGHPLAGRLGEAIAFGGEAYRDYERRHLANFHFDDVSKLWKGKHFVGEVPIDLEPLREKNAAAS